MEDDTRDRKHRTGRRTAGSVFGRLGERGHDRTRERSHDRDRDERPGREEPVTFTITLTGAAEERVGGKRRSMETAEKVNEDAVMAEGEAEAEGEGENAKKVKKQRCQFWPNCKRGEACIYVHPTTQCNQFPNCSYGDNCLYIHPAIPCKFGASCTRVGCSYNHPAGATVSAQKGGVPCKHGFACPREGCTFAHPPEACRYGEGCTRPNCHFGHGKACRFGVTCATPGCTFTHYKDINTPCMFGANCTKLTCKFQHNNALPTKEDQEMVEAAVNELSATLPPTPPREPQVVV